MLLTQSWFIYSGATQVVILTADPNTGELTEKVVSADEINAVVEQNQVESQDSSQEDVQQQFRIVEDDGQEANTGISGQHVELTQEQLMSSQVTLVFLFFRESRVPEFDN